MPRRHLPNSIPWAAKEVGVSTSTMHRIVTRGEVKFVEVNGLRRIPDSEIDRLKELLGGGLAERVRELDRKRLAIGDRVRARKQRLLEELRELEAS
jgi:hypothetical protein